jgi:hypothetical protein
MHSFFVAAVTKGHKLTWLNDTNVLSYTSVSQKFNPDLTGLKLIGFVLNTSMFLFRILGGKSVSLPF